MDLTHIKTFHGPDKLAADEGRLRRVAQLKNPTRSREERIQAAIAQTKRILKMDVLIKGKP